MMTDKVQDGTTYTPPSDELRDEFKAKYNGYGVKDLAATLKQLKEEHDIQKAKVAAIYHEWNYVRFLLVLVMDDMEVTNIKFKGIGRLEQRHDLSAKQVDAEGLRMWMIDHGHEEMISEVINSSSLKSFLKNQIAEGEELPPDDVVQITPFSYATVVKA